MKNVLIKDALILPVDEQKPPFFRGDILTAGNKIKKIVERPQTIDSDEVDTLINGSNLIVMPGFINTHGHAAMSLFRSYADDMPLKDWLEKKIWPIESLLEGDDVYWGTMLSIAEMIKSGTTTFTDMYFFMDRAAEAVEESGIRAVLSRGLLGPEIDSPDAMKINREFINDWHGKADGRINVIYGPHSIITVPPEVLQEVMAENAKTGLPIQIHLSETAGEVEDCRAKHGASPVEYLSKIGLLDFKVIAAHCVHVSDGDIELLAEKQVGVCHNPGSNLKLGSGIAPVSKMLKKGIKVGLGTDGASSNNNLDMLEEMRLAALLAKGVSLDPTLINADTALEMATAMGAEILGLENTGRLREGYKADLIGFNCNSPHLTPMHDPRANLVYAAVSSDVTLNMVDGNILLLDGILQTLDEEKVIAEANRYANRLAEGRKNKK